jgi:hypothetical protein
LQVFDSHQSDSSEAATFRHFTEFDEQSVPALHSIIEIIVERGPIRAFR